MSFSLQVLGLIKNFEILVVWQKRNDYIKKSKHLSCSYLEYHKSTIEAAGPEGMLLKLCGAFKIEKVYGWLQMWHGFTKTYGECGVAYSDKVASETVLRQSRGQCTADSRAERPGKPCSAAAHPESLGEKRGSCQSLPRDI